MMQHGDPDSLAAEAFLEPENFRTGFDTPTLDAAPPPGSIRAAVESGALPWPLTARDNEARLARAAEAGITARPVAVTGCRLHVQFLLDGEPCSPSMEPTRAEFWLIQLAWYARLDQPADPAWRR